MKSEQSSGRKNKTGNKRTGIKAEAIIFLEKNILNSMELKNYTFERLKYIDGHITDFHCKELKAVIDIIPSPGKRSMNKKVSENSEQKKIPGSGYKMFVFTYKEILNEPEKIKRILSDLIKPQPIHFNLDDFGFIPSDNRLF